jgi:hypothetical protein
MFLVEISVSLILVGFAWLFRVGLIGLFSFWDAGVRFSNFLLIVGGDN